MLRQFLLSLVTGTMLTWAGGGCRSCSSCHDYDSPVAGCSTSGCGRTGSVSDCGAGSPCDGVNCECAGGACQTGDGSSGNCHCGNHGASYESDDY